MTPAARLVRFAFLLVPERWQRRLRALPLAGRLAGRVSHACSPAGERTWVTVRRGPAQGLRVHIDPRFERFVWAGEDEFASVAHRFVDLLAPGMVVYDVGAHSGLYSLIAARRVGPDGGVVAFEPDPANVARLREHLAANGASTVEVVEAAVWSESERVRFVPDETHALRDRGYVAGAGGDLPAVSLDDFARSRADPDVIKIDVEGAEEHVLRGARALLARARPTVLCEVHAHDGGDPRGITAVDELLHELGYETVRTQFKPQVVHVVGRPL